MVFTFKWKVKRREKQVSQDITQCFAILTYSCNSINWDFYFEILTGSTPLGYASTLLRKWFHPVFNSTCCPHADPWLGIEPRYLTTSFTITQSILHLDHGNSLWTCLCTSSLAPLYSFSTLDTSMSLLKGRLESCPLHCSKPSNNPNSLRVKTNILTMACKALHHLPISFHTLSTSLTSPSPSRLVQTPPATDPVDGPQTYQGCSVFRAIKFAVLSAWTTMSPFSHMAPSLASFRSSINHCLLKKHSLRTLI